MAEYLATCHTEGCGNAGVTVPIFAFGQPPLVVCGPCAEPIADLEPVEQ